MGKLKLKGNKFIIKSEFWEIWIMKLKNILIVVKDIEKS